MLAGCVAPDGANTAHAVEHPDMGTPAAEHATQDARTAALRTNVILTIAPYITVEGKDKRYWIGVVGTDAVAAALRELPGKKVDQADVTVSAVEPEVAASGDGAGDLDLLWIAASVDDTTLQSIIAAHADKPVVLVCERSGFAALGGGLQLFAQDNCMRFELNAEAMKKQGLRPSAQLLRLSRKGPCR